MLIQTIQRTLIRRSRRYLALLLALTGLLALPLQARHDHPAPAFHSSEAPAQQMMTDADCAQHAAVPFQPAAPSTQQADHGCQCLLACASAAAVIVTTAVPSPLVMAMPSRFVFHSASLPFAPPVPPYRPPIHTASV